MIPLALLLNRYTAGAAALAVVAASAWWYRGELIQTGYDQAMVEMREAASIADAAARSRELEAAQTLADIQQKANDEKARLSADLAAALDSLRKRPARPAGAVPASPSDPVGCTGASLFAEDASAALREAARADRLRADLETCRAAYDSAVRLTNP
jgi:hypothetical protein